MNKLKISMNVEYKNGPWGGGNLFIANLKDFLVSKGHEVIFDLFDSDIDIILIIDPRMLSESVVYSVKDIKFYVKNVNKNCKVIHRINECDERKNTNGINEYYINANKVADFTVFVSQWLKDIFIQSGFSQDFSSVIMSGANKKVFNNKDRLIWTKSEPLKIVTHHWGNNFNKGFDIYSFLDRSIHERYKDEIIFTYIGNLNENLKFKSTRVLEPTYGKNLASLIKDNHIYLTASINEPSGNHHIEGAQCGLPILYRDSGGVPEFAKGYGVEFQGIEDFFKSLERLKNNYLELFRRVEDYPFNSEKMCKDYLDLFHKVKTSSFDSEATVIKTSLKDQTEKLFYLLNKLLSIIKLYKLKNRVKKYFLIKIPILKKERNVV
jgi:hypothetical protein